jgi:hypothetical protein
MYIRIKSIKGFDNSNNVAITPPILAKCIND